MYRHIRLLLLVTLILLSAGVALGHDPVRIEVTTSDGVQIVGDYWTPIRGQSHAPAVILLHMYQSDRTAWDRDIFVALEMAGFAIARIDLRGHGESQGDPEMKLAEKVSSRDTQLFDSMKRDVEAVVGWLSARPEVDSSHLSLLGASVGCSVALDYAREHDSVRAVVLMSPGTRYLGLDSLTHIAQYQKGALLMLTSKQEQARGFHELVKVARNTGVELQTRIFEQDGIHGTQMFGQVAGVEELIASFLKRHTQ